MKLKRFAIRMAIALLLVGVVGTIASRTGIIVANGADDGDAPITGDALTQASAAALGYLGGGRVTDTEIGDEDGYYEVEITLNDGSEVDMHLNEYFDFISQETDAETPDAQDGTNNH